MPAPARKVISVALRVRQKLGKYRIEKRLAEGGFSAVYQAMDTIEGIRVALKVPHTHLVTPEVLEDFRREVRLLARLEHPNILPVKDASFIDGYFVIAFPLGEQTLAERLRRRMSLLTILDYSEQILQATAYAHANRIVHCDIKPENIIIFPGHRLRLTDFGIAKIAARTIRGAGTGTVGHMAPEQAMGRPSPRSDVFSIGLIIYRMLAGVWPEWPYDWPPPEYRRVRRRVPQDFIDLLRKSLALRPQRRFRDAGQMLNAFRRLRRRVLRYHQSRRGG
ncbi:MAG: serine/threonine protein kinase [Planctomycetota bacterium]|nr:MAG: serine/threonine protein kinase [Planctomycetota bacterium]